MHQILQLLEALAIWIHILLGIILLLGLRRSLKVVCALLLLLNDVFQDLQALSRLIGPHFELLVEDLLILVLYQIFVGFFVLLNNV